MGNYIKSAGVLYYIKTVLELDDNDRSDVFSVVEYSLLEQIDSASFCG